MKCKLFAFFVVLLVIIGCDTAISTTLYVADVFSDKKEMNIRATITTEYSESSEQEIITLLKETFAGAKNFRKEKVGYSDHLKFDFDLMFVDESKLSKMDDGELFTLIKKRESTTVVNVGVALDKMKFEELDNTISSQFYGDIEFEDLKFNIDINNDYEDNINFKIKSSYVNGEAVPFEKDYTLNKRDVLEVKFSEILKQAFLTEEVNYFSTFSK